MEAARTFDKDRCKQTTDTEIDNLDELYEEYEEEKVRRNFLKLRMVGKLVSSTPPRVSTRQIEIDAFTVEPLSKNHQILRKAIKNEFVAMLKQENDELRKQINDLKVTLKINKDCMKIMLEPSNQFQQVNVINSFVKENIKLQNEVFRVQK